MNSDFGWYVQDDLREGIELGIREIPVLLVNGKKVDRPLTASKIITAIQAELKLVKKPVKKRKKDCLIAGSLSP